MFMERVKKKKIFFFSFVKSNYIGLHNQKYGCGILDTLFGTKLGDLN